MVAKCHEEVVFLVYERNNNNFIQVVDIECPCGLVVKCKCFSIYQLQNCNIDCLCSRLKALIV